MIVGPELLTKAHLPQAFDCGQPALNEWLQRFALTNKGAGMTQTYVIHIEQRIIGYYSLCAGGIARKSALPRVLQGIGWHEEIPVVLLARLATDNRYQGRGLGAALLKDALLRSLHAADTIAARAIVVHAINDEAVSFYEKYDFSKSPQDDRTLMVLMRDVRALFRP